MVLPARSPPPGNPSRNPGQAPLFGFFDVIVSQAFEEGQRQAVVKQHRPVELLDVEVVAQLILCVLAQLEDLQHAGFVSGELADVVEERVDMLGGQPRSGTHRVDEVIDRLLIRMGVT